MSARVRRTIPSALGGASAGSAGGLLLKPQGPTIVIRGVHLAAVPEELVVDRCWEARPAT